MKRLIASLALFVSATPSLVRAQSPAELAQTAAHVAAFQNSDGGFAPQKGMPSTLGATSSSIRVLKYTGGSIPDVLGCIRFVKSCFAPESGGFPPKPGGAPDVGTTATGLMAIAELKGIDKDMVASAVRYFEKNARSFEDVRIAVAGLEAVKATSAEFPHWTEVILNGRNADGTFGQGEGQARETGGKAVALLRMGVPLDKKAEVVAFLKSAQRPDGGWSKGPAGSELESTYRIMRAFFMLEELPDVERLEAFVGRCRHADGTYGISPTDATSGGTYYATIVSRWLRLLSGLPARVETAGFRPLFNGRDLTGWEGDTTVWSVRDGMLVGKTDGLKKNNFLATEASWNNFVFKTCFRLVGGKGNSGIQFRSVRVPGHEMSGYQADVGEQFWGCLYDESRRNKVLVHASDEALKAIRKDGWNEYVLRAGEERIRLDLNGKNSVDYKEPDPQIARSGRFAVQVHAGGPVEVQFKDIYIQELPQVRESSDDTPGFHLRTMKSHSGRKFVVYVPPGYDGSKPFPVVLFLHGASLVGRDGIKPVFSGLAPAILANAKNFAAIAVIPQAEKTWEAGSEDAKAALAALDEVHSSFKTDRTRVVITGLSMGGRGAWEIAAEQPERFSAVVPVCGRGKADGARSLAGLPLWAFVGDNDRDETVLNNRAMITAIAAAGGKPRYTEYRDVGHNSWDRAYNDPALIAWMLEQTRP
jgi:poly(3-hydroxybutyrate) depolymerase